MVNPIQITQPQAYSGGVDFSPLAGLYDVYKKSQERAMEEAALGRLGNDPIANAQYLTTSGVKSLAPLGIGMQDKEIARRREDISNEQAQRNWVEQQKLRQSADVRAGSEEARAQAKQAEALKYATREQRLAAYKTGVDAGEIDKDNPEIKRWVAFGGDIPDAAKNRLGLSPVPIMEPDPDKPGQLRPSVVQLSTTGATVRPTLPPGAVFAGPGEIAQKKAEGTALGKGAGAGQVALPDVIRTTDDMITNIDSIIGHTSKKNALGMYANTPEWALQIADPHALDFRERVAQLSGEAMQANMSLLRGSGLGSVSDFEQKNMMAAFLRAGRAKNQADFDTAMTDARRSAEKIREVARNKAKGDFTEKGERPAATGAATPTTAGGDPYAKAKAAISAGAPPAAVRQRLIDAGLDPSKIGM